MDRTAVAIGAILVALCCQGSIAQTSPGRGTRSPYVPYHPALTKEQIAQIKPPTKPDISQALIEQLKKDYSQYRTLAYTKNIDCKPGADGVCQNRATIYMFQWTDSNGTYCVGLVPKYVYFANTAMGNPPKRIIWELQPLNPATPITPAGSSFEFLDDGDRGVLVFQNIGSGANVQFHGGMRGSGPNPPGPPNTDVDKFHMMNKHTAKGIAAYLPIVVHRVPNAPQPNGQVADELGLCGVPDPMLYND